MRQQYGFTLLELMVAMAIFAMLAVAGWQVFDSVNRARERAQFHADNLAVLQYAYLQLQQDMGQIIPYQAPSTQDASTATGNENSKNNVIDPEPFMSLDGEHVSFVRFADPDPRYQSSASVQKIEYIFADERLIRRQYTNLSAGSDSVSLDSVLLEGVSAARWQAYLPEIATRFPEENSGTNNGNNSNNMNRASAQTANVQSEVKLLPKGIAVTFTYQDMPITWQWALAPQLTPNISINTSDKNTANNPNGNDDNNGNGNSNGDTNTNEANGNVANNNSGNGIENSLFGQ